MISLVLLVRLESDRQMGNPRSVGDFPEVIQAIDGVGKIEGPCVEVVEEEKAKGRVTVAQVAFGMTLCVTESNSTATRRGRGL